MANAISRPLLPLGWRMAEKLTILSVPADATAHAERFGAQHDSASGTWLVVGPVHRELQNYLPRPKKQRFQEAAPRCPRCGASTHKLINRKGDWYWACVMRFKTGCRGVVDYLEHLDAVAPVARVGDFLPNVVGSLFGPHEPPAPQAERKPHPLRARWVEIAQATLEILGDEKQALRWLDHPKVALRNKAPVLMLGTEAGCDAVINLLRDVWK